MFKFSLRNIIGLVIICGALILSEWIYFPLKEHEQVTTIPGIGQQRLIWTPIIRFGEVADIRLEFSSEDGQQEIISFLNEKNVELDLTEEIIIGKTHHLVIESRIEITGSKVQPNEEISQSFNQREKLIFIWQITPVIRENVSGEVWLYLHLIPLASAIDIRRPVSIQGITIQTIDLLGTNTGTAKILVVVGIGIGLILWFDMIGKINQVIINWKQER